MLFLKSIWLLTSLIIYTERISSEAVFGLDLGDDTVKVGMVAHGKGIGIMLDGQSKRLIPSTVYFDEEERHFGNEAKLLVIKILFIYIL